MGTWNAMIPEGKDTILRVVRHEAEQFFDLVDSDRAWEAPTGAGHWQVRDLVGHLVDTTEAYFVSFDAARSHQEPEAAYGLPGMAARCDERAQAFRSVPRPELVERARTDFEKMMEIFVGLRDEDWTGLLVPHFYMGPLPAFFYLWQYTTHPVTPDEVCEIGIRITSGPNAGGTRISLTEDGFSYAAGAIDDVTVLELDPGSFVLTAFGRSNAGTLRGDREVADRFLNIFFRI